jgi:ABC-type microcin C transport system permease subunit YejB
VSINRSSVFVLAYDISINSHTYNRKQRNDKVTSVVVVVIIIIISFIISFIIIIMFSG